MNLSQWLPLLMIGTPLVPGLWIFLLDEESHRLRTTINLVGAILNVSAALTREDVLQGLEETDAAFAEQVRRALFTFVHLPARLPARDVPKLIRIVDQPVLVTALAASLGKPMLEAASDFLLANMSPRMAQGLREEMATRGRVKDKDAEAAMSSIITAIRQLEAAGEVVLIREDE